MTYEWLRIGNSEDTYRKICVLGPYTLEILEVGWNSVSRDLILNCNVYIWDHVESKYDQVKTNLCNTQCLKTAQSKLEDWYACNVLLEQLITSKTDSE